MKKRYKVKMPKADESDFIRYRKQKNFEPSKIIKKSCPICLDLSVFREEVLRDLKGKEVRCNKCGYNVRY